VGLGKRGAKGLPVARAGDFEHAKTRKPFGRSD